MHDIRRWITLCEGYKDSLTAEPFETIDPISKQPGTSFRIRRDGKEVGVLAGRFAKTSDDAITLFRDRESRSADEQRRADAERAAWYDRRNQAPAPRQSNFEVVAIDTIDSTDEPDDYYYHVTTRPKQVLRDGLRANRRAAMDAGFYREYSAGKVFFCERPGVPYWLWKIGDHLEAQYEKPPKLSVLRFPKPLVNDAQTDVLGTRDSGEDSYFVTHAIR